MVTDSKVYSLLVKRIQSVIERHDPLSLLALGHQSTNSNR